MIHEASYAQTLEVTSPHWLSLIITNEYRLIHQYQDRKMVQNSHVPKMSYLRLV
jgi:hypothetical protein